MAKLSAFSETTRSDHPKLLRYIIHGRINIKNMYYIAFLTNEYSKLEHSQTIKQFIDSEMILLSSNSFPRAID